MSKVVVLSEFNCINYLRAKGFEPVEFYTDLEEFKERSIFFNDVIVVMILSGACTFPRNRVIELQDTLSQRAITDNDKGVADFIVLSDAILPHCKDYFLYRDNPMNCIRYSGWRVTSNTFHLTDLVYEKSKTTTIYLTDRDYGYNPNALDGVRAVDKSEKELISLIKVPSFD